MRVWAFTVAVLLGIVSWRADLLDLSSRGGDAQTIVGAGPDDGTVTAMEDPFGPPKP